VLGKRSSFGEVTVPDSGLGDRRLYPDLKAHAYLAYAATAPISSLVKAAVNRVLDGYAEQGNVAFFDWIEQRERLREKLGQLVGAPASDIALTSGTTRGISDLALCLPWQAGQRVVLFEGEFPANVSPWQHAARLFGLRVERVPMAHAVEDEDSFLAPLAKLLEGGARLVAVSAVQFQTGLKMPLDRIAQLCARYGAELCVDAIQACGVVPLDAPALGIDYLVTGAHKWLLGPEGVGFMYARPERARALVPRTAGWLSHEDGTRFLFAGPGELRYDRPVKPTLQMVEGGSSSTLGFAALEAGIEPILALSPSAIFAHVNRYLDLLEPDVSARGFRSRRAPEAERRSGILSFEPPQGVSATDVVMQLRTRGVFASMPDGLLRFAPHFPNAMSEIDTVLPALDEALAALRNR
jgi:cysteine desulfurase / selenocysteine lyase